MNVKAKPDMPSWSFDRVGPFYKLQRRLGLISDTDLFAGRRALLFAAIAFLPVLALAALNGDAFGATQHALLHDFRAYALVIAIAAFVLMEGSADRRMTRLVHEFQARELVTEVSRPGFERARVNMERRTGWAWVEALLLVAAYMAAFEWAFQLSGRVPGGTWVGKVVDGRFELTLAGMWGVAVTMPLCLFLYGRWLWRFVTWGLLLRDISRCEMRLVSTHADRCGGLAFIGQYPSTYMLFVFAMSTVISSGVLTQVVHHDASLAGFKFAAIGLVLFVLVAFVLPLLAFTPTLVRVKRHGLRQYGALISRHNQAFHTKWIAGDAAKTDEILGAPDMSSLADLSMSYDMVKKMLPLPFVLEGVVPLLVAVLLPMAVVATAAAPISEVLQGLKALMLL